MKKDKKPKKPFNYLAQKEKEREESRNRLKQTVLRFRHSHYQQKSI